ncbi:hypothetical protein HOY80DRAFT_1098330 [Tuber brumale]|nr:hypothetical protein HOY80DRAFT_1098330 [Tuber brumale]
MGTPDDINSGDALGSEESKFPEFKFLASSAMKEAVNATCRMGVVDDSSSNGEFGTDPDDVAILNEEKGSDKDDTSDAESDLLSHNEDGRDESSDEGAQDEEAKRREELKKLITQEQINVVANFPQAFKADTEKGTAVKPQLVYIETFDSLQGVRIKLQEAIIANNSLPTTSPSPQLVPETYKVAEGVSLNPWSPVTDLRCDLCSPSTPKRNGHLHSPFMGQDAKARSRSSPKLEIVWVKWRVVK